MADSAAVATVVSKRSALVDRSGVGVEEGVCCGSAGELLMVDVIGEKGCVMWYEGTLRTNRCLVSTRAAELKG
jgi:hypothetical protein